MFRKTELGETQYCPICEEWAEKYERLQSENELLKDANAHLKTELKQRYDEPDFESFRLMGKTINEWKQLGAENKQLKKALKEIRGTLKLSNDCILDIISEVLDERN